MDVYAWIDPWAEKARADRAYRDGESAGRSGVMQRVSQESFSRAMKVTAEELGRKLAASPETTAAVRTLMVLLREEARGSSDFVYLIAEDEELFEQRVEVMRPLRYSVWMRTPRDWRW